MSLHTQRRREDAGRQPRQTCTRIPPYRRGEWVVLADGRVRQLHSLVCVVTTGEQIARWKACFVGQEQCDARLIVRAVRADEVERVTRGGGR